MGFSIGIIGPLCVQVGDRQVSLAAGNQRIVLASLVVRANRAVSLDELVNFVWGEHPPRSAAATLRNYVKRLRGVLGQAAADRIATRNGGYLIRLDTSELDATLFESLCGRGGAAIRDGDWPAAHATLSHALSIWRGVPLLDVPSQVLRDEVVPRLERQRLLAIEDRIEADLSLGRHDRLVPELESLVAAHPLRERFHGQLMLALAGTGRRAEALVAYQRIRRELVGELGVEPGPQVQELHRRILVGDPRLALPRPPARDTAVRPARIPPVPPRQLPAPVRHFTGRGRELQALTNLLAPTGRSADMVIGAISGTAGIGKTALAVHWACRYADRFPDGQLYVNLRGFDPSARPVPAAAALRCFLDAFGVPSTRIPVDLDAQIGLYRSVLAGKRVLILLDNACEPEQVRPLLPGAPGCLVLITSRSRLTDLVALDGAEPVTVDLLSRAEAALLLARRLGRVRIHRAALAADELVDLCARLPLALNIVASHALSQPALPLGELAAELVDARHRLDRLRAGAGAADLRAVFSWSYQKLTGPAAHVFRMLGVHPGPDICLATAASLAGTGVAETHRALSELTAAHLTEQRADRYRSHDLLRAYAAEQVRTDERAPAVYRLLDHYLHTAHRATLLLFPARDPVALSSPQPGIALAEIDTERAALAWFDAERPALVAIATLAAAEGFDSHAWQIPTVAAAYLERRGHWPEYATTQAVALSAAQRAGDITGQANAHLLLGRASSRVGERAGAHTHLIQALHLYRQLDDVVGQAHAHHSLGWNLGQQAHYDAALDHARQALALYRAAGHATGQARTLNTVGWYGSLLGRHREALTYCQQALDLHRQLGNHDGEADAWDSLAHAHHHLGQYADAVTCYQRAIELFEKLGDRHQQADTLSRLAGTYGASGDRAGAEDARRRAAAILDELDHPDPKRPPRQ